MKVSISGKGGSGKSSVTALLAGALTGKGYSVIVVDSDESNRGLCRMLGFDSPPESILEYVGGKQQVKNLFPRSDGAGAEQPRNTLDRITLEGLPSRYVLGRDGVRLVTIGKITQSLEGCACPMGLLGREFLARLCPNKDEFVLVDMEAGVEHLGRGLETAVDALLAVVDPTFESIELAGEMGRMAAGIKNLRHVSAIVNKVPSDLIASRIEQELKSRSMSVIGLLPHDDLVFETGLEGQRLKCSNCSEGSRQIAERLISLHQGKIYQQSGR